MKSRSPSSTRGRNSAPSRKAMGTAEASATLASSNVRTGRVRANWTKGRYRRTSVRVRGLANSGRTLPRRSISRRAGAKVSATSAAVPITSVLLKASGRRSRPVSPVKARTGRKLRAAMRSAVTTAGPKEPAAASKALRRSFSEAPAPNPSSRRWHASSATTSASTASPRAMPIPPRLMSVAGIPSAHIAR